MFGWVFNILWLGNKSDEIRQRGSVVNKTALTHFLDLYGKGDSHFLVCILPVKKSASEAEEYWTGRVENTKRIIKHYRSVFHPTLYPIHLFILIYVCFLQTHNFIFSFSEIRQRKISFKFRSEPPNVNGKQSKCGITSHLESPWTEAKIRNTHSEQFTALVSLSWAVTWSSAWRHLCRSAWCVFRSCLCYQDNIRYLTLSAWAWSHPCAAQSPTSSVLSELLSAVCLYSQIPFSFSCCPVLTFCH